MDVLQTSPPFSSLSVEGVSGRDEKGMLGRRGTQRGSDVVSLVTATSSALVNGLADGWRAYVAKASKRRKLPSESGRGRICQITA